MRENIPTILIVDDTETNIDILLGLLGNYDVAVATDGKTALNIIKNDDIDLVLLDIMMPEMDGYDVCLELKKYKQSIPVIFITARTDEDSIEKAYDVGGDDYITKPFKPRELMARVKTQLKIKELIYNLEYIASYDQMTGIYNRRKFFQLANEKFDNYDDLYAVMIDIDKFKLVNDNYGHAIGDEVIKKVAKTIDDFLSTNSIFGRLGGEEFAIVTSTLTYAEVEKKIEQVRQKIQDLEVLSDSGDIIKFTISEGVAKKTKQTQNLDELLKEADKALYDAKGHGRNRVVFRT